MTHYLDRGTPGARSPGGAGSDPGTTTLTQPPVAPTSGADLVPPNLGERVERRVPMTRLAGEYRSATGRSAADGGDAHHLQRGEYAAGDDAAAQYQEEFQARHNGTRLGFMSFFVKAAVNALKEIPELNAEIDGDEIVYKNFYNIGVAVSTPQGLVVPVVRDADAKNMAEIEKNIVELGTRARDGKITMDDMQGGTFTVTNGGIFGSLLSTPILNTPQTAILGMHKIQDRPMAVNGKVEILPMMYLALSYDHRIIDGKESVGFLVTVKEMLEDPTRLLLDV